MAHRFAFQFAASWIIDANLFILAGGDQLGAVPVEAGAINDVRMGVNVHQNLASAHVPDDDLIETRRKYVNPDLGYLRLELYLVIGARCEQHIER